VHGKGEQRIELSQNLFNSIRKNVIGQNVNSNTISSKCYGLGCERANRRANNERVNRMANGSFPMHFLIVEWLNKRMANRIANGRFLMQFPMK